MATVLVVDDARIMRMNIRRILEKLGHEVIAEAQNADEAISLYETLKPELITMDIEMPSVNNSGDGISAVKTIKDIDSNAKIIMISSHGEQTKIIRAIQNGAANYILKPVSEEKMKMVIKKLELEI